MAADVPSEMHVYTDIIKDTTEDKTVDIISYIFIICWHISVMDCIIKHAL